MATAFKNYFYEHQLEKYYLQFLAIFAGLQVKVGKNDRSSEEKFISVPIYNGSRDRISGWIKGDFTQNKPLRLPVMSASISGIEMAPELRKGVNVSRRQSYLPRAGLIPDDITVVEQHMPVPYTATADLFIWASNHQQRYQILEQILVVFDPLVQIQKNDALFDWTKITNVELTGIAYEDNYPMGADRRMLLTTLSFTFPIYLTAPANVKKNFVKDIYVRIGAISQASNTNEEIIAELDALGIKYEQWYDGDTLDLPEF